MMGTVKCLLEHFFVFVTGYHWIVQLQLVDYMGISQHAAVQLIECSPMMGTVKCLLKQLIVFVTGHRWIVQLQLVGHLDISQYATVQLIECGTCFARFLFFLRSYDDEPIGWRRCIDSKGTGLFSSSTSCLMSCTSAE